MPAGKVQLNGALAQGGAGAKAGPNGVQAGAGGAVSSKNGNVKAAGGIAVSANKDGISVKAGASVSIGKSKPPAKSASPARQPDPAQVALFRIELDGITEAEFLECSGLKNSTEVVEYYEGGENTHMHKFIGNTKYPNIVLKKGITANSKKLWEWRNAITENKKPLFKNGAVVLLNDKFQEICRWNFKNGWPCRWDGPDLKAGTSALAVEVLEIAHDGFSVNSGKMDAAFK
ncbi:MAG: phage tail protein [Myxococcota bacterium]